MSISTEVIVKKVNENFDIALSATPSAGYEWEIEEIPDGLHFEGEKSVLDNDAIGSPNQSIFHFRVVSKGSFQLHFILKRRWETTAIDEVLYKIVVE